MAKKKTKTGKSKQKIRVSDSLVILMFLGLVLVIIFVSGEINNDENPQESQPAATVQNPEILVSKLDSEIIAGDVIDIDMLDELARKNYYTLKNELESDSDFIIYFEDESGNLVEVVGRSCIGSGNASINGQNCDR